MHYSLERYNIELKEGSPKQTDSSTFAFEVNSRGVTLQKSTDVDGAMKAVFAAI